MNNNSLIKKIKLDYMNEENNDIETYDIHEKNQTTINYLDDMLEHPFIDSLESNTYPLKATNINIVLYRLNKFNEIDYIEYYLLNGQFLSITTSYDSDYDIESTKEASEFTVYSRAYSYLSKIDPKDKKNIKVINSFDPKAIKKSLNTLLDYFISTEEYERCAHIHKILEKITK